MPNGGHLTIETANTYLDAAYVRRFGDVEAGQYVVLCVTDTGTGIPKEILDHVFEPFFTTKPTGEGSGLGLAMVHGFVKQSGGHMRIYSEEGEGTTVKIYLPRLTNAEEVSAAPAGKQADVSPVPHAQNGETILIVEDNEGVRDYAKEVLGELGYAVLEAGNADQALEVLARARRVDLLFTDVVLPGGANGRELANRAAQRISLPPRALHHGLYAERHRASGPPRRRCRAAEQALHAAGPGPQSPRHAGRLKRSGLARSSAPPATNGR